ncbi:VOC family protein [Psychromonas ossibalaenae]|uniref:VOC family protein n=1 Tax=Psychromonas ossibalaenae TaxID=444922 RepID=UPI00035D385F|nr:VOC family protein [Psychromonas ossibalaenae]
MQYQQLKSQWPDFSQNILDFALQLGLTNLPLVCDHAALRVNDQAAAQVLLEQWQEQGQVISDSIINGRPIYIIALHEPLLLGDWQIDCVELPFPGKPYPQQGWEHIELVLPGNAATIAELEQILDAMTPDIKAVLAANPAIKIKRSAPQAEGERLANPTIAFKLDNICIKVHGADIKAVIASEKEQNNF